MARESEEGGGGGEGGEDENEDEDGVYRSEGQEEGGRGWGEVGEGVEGADAFFVCSWVWHGHFSEEALEKEEGVNHF